MSTQELRDQLRASRRVLAWLRASGALGVERLAVAESRGGGLGVGHGLRAMVAYEVGSTRSPLR